MKVLNASTHKLCLMILLALLVLIPSFGAHARPSNLSPEVAKLIQEVPLKGAYREAGAVTILKEGRITVGRNGLCSITVHVVGKILDSKAVSDYGQISRYFNSYFEDATLDFARTIKPDGKILEVSKDATQIKTQPGAKIYTDIRSLSFSLPALEEGSVFEYQEKIKQKHSLIEKHWNRGFNFCHILNGISRIDPVYKSRFILEVPEGEEFVYQVENLKVSPTIKKEGGFVTYIWEVKDLPRITIEQYMPLLIEMIPKIEVSSLKEWSAVDEWAGHLYFPQIQATEEIKAKAEHITRGANTEEDKIEAIFYFIQNNIEYVQADLFRGGHTPHPAKEILQNRYGDCKDQVVLLLSMLKALAITAYPALINPISAARTNRKLPSPRFSHLIVYIPLKEGDLWLDTTSSVTEFPSLFWTNQNRWAFIIDGKGGKFIRTPSSKPEDNRGIIHVDNKFNGGTLNCRITVKGKGAISDNLKSLLKPLPTSQQDHIISDLVKGIFTNAQVRSIEFSDLEDPRLPFKATALTELKFTGIEQFQIFFFQSSAMSMLSFFAGFHNLPSPGNRKGDFFFPFKFTLIQEMLCPPLTQEFKASVLPQDESLGTRILLFNNKFSREGECIKAKSEFVFTENRVSNEEYGSFYKSVQEALEKSNWQVVFRKQRIDKQEKELEEKVEESPEDIKTLLKLSKHYLTKGKYEEAKELLNKAVTIDPENGEVHYFLGLALGYLDRYDEGKKEFEKAKELGYEP